VNIYVGNIPYTVTDEDLRQAFGEFGTVTSTSIIIDKITGRSRGFGFVEMSTDEEGNRAIEEMNGKDWMGRTLTVNEAKPRESRPSGGGYGGGGGYSGAPRRSSDGGGRSDGGPREFNRGGGGYGGGSPEFNRGGAGGGRGGDRDRNRHGAGGARGAERERGGGKSYDRWQDNEDEAD
jgi:RNA recognition motif-containing protein